MRHVSVLLNAAVVLNFIALLCWIIMFLAGTDVWHDTGGHDFWRLDGPPYRDLRVLACAFYMLFFVLVCNLVLQIRARARNY